MKNSLKNITYKENLYKRLNTTTGTIIAIFTVFGMGVSAGIYFHSVQSNKEIAEIGNKHTLELIDLREKHSSELNKLNNSQIMELIQLQREITLLKLENEKAK